jgi:hypothetical protein
MSDEEFEHLVEKALVQTVCIMGHRKGPLKPNTLDRWHELLRGSRLTKQ